MIRDEETLNMSSPYYQAVYDRYAQRLNYPTFSDLLDDIQDIMAHANMPGQDIWDKHRDADAATRLSYQVSGVVGGIAALGNLYMRSVYKIPICKSADHLRVPCLGQHTR